MGAAAEDFRSSQLGVLGEILAALACRETDESGQLVSKTRQLRLGRIYRFPCKARTGSWPGLSWLELIVFGTESALGTKLRGGSLRKFSQDFRFSIRSLRRRPVYSITVLTILALAMGANTSIFSIFNQVLLEPLPYRGSQDLYVVWERNPSNGSRLGPSPPNFDDWRREAVLWKRMAVFSPATVILLREDRPVQVAALMVSPGFFEMLETRIMQGRAFTDTDGRQGSPWTAIVSHHFWESHFPGQRPAPGSILRGPDRSREIIGILPEGFYFPGDPQVYLPIQFSPEQLNDDMRGARYLGVLGRVQPDTLETAAESELASIIQGHPQNEGWDVDLVPFHEHVAGAHRTPLTVLFGAVILLLFVACANVGGLMLSRLAERRLELGIRSSLGATRFHLLRQVLVETLVLFVAGGLLGLVVAFWLIESLIVLAPTELPRADYSLGAVAILYSLLSAVGLGALFGIIPALRITRQKPAETLMSSTRTQSLAGYRLRSVLVISEIAVSLILLCGAGLLIRSFTLLRSEDPGFNPQRGLVLNLALPDTRYPDERDQSRFLEEVIERLNRISGVRYAGASTNLPLSGSAMTFGFSTPGSASEENNFAQYHAATSDYFQAMGITLLKGRGFLPTDRPGAQPVAIVNETMERRYYPQGAVGQQIQHSSKTGWSQREIVGVVRDVKHSSLASGAVPEFYVPFQQDPWQFFSIVIRTQDDAEQVVDQVREQVWAEDPMLPADGIFGLEVLISRSMAELRFQTLLLGFFGVVALVLAAVGLYGVLALTVAYRRKELGIRMALGASRKHIYSDLFSQGLKLVTIGAILGLIGAAAVTQVLRSLLYGVDPLDPATFIGVVFVLVLISLVACLWPARRAAAVDPAKTLSE